jgi:DNA-binding response OmpR family regulator
VSDSVDIVVIDDNVMQLEYMTDLLTQHGFTIHTTTDSQNAVDKIKKIKPKLIILDIMMPRLDGYTVLKRIREDKNMAKTPVIIYTSKSFPIDEKKALNLGANSYIVKPVKGAILVEEVRKYI